MSYFFLLVWFIFTATILGTALLFVLATSIKAKMRKRKEDKYYGKDNE